MKIVESDSDDMEINSIVNEMVPESSKKRAILPVKKIRLKISSVNKKASMKVASSSEEEEEDGTAVMHKEQRERKPNEPIPKNHVLKKKQSIVVESSTDERTPTPFGSHGAFAFSASELQKSEERRSNSQKRKKENKRSPAHTPTIVISQPTPSRESLASSMGSSHSAFDLVPEKLQNLKSHSRESTV